MASVKKKILFLSSNNAIRSQIAEALYRNTGDKQYETQSAGLNISKPVHPFAIRVMNEIGIDISQRKANSVRDFLGKESFNTVLFYVLNRKNNAPKFGLEYLLKIDFIGHYKILPW
jgi:arsenate reductase